MPRWKFWAKTAGIVNGGAKGAVDAGLKGAKGGNGLTSPVPAFCDHGLLKERGVEELPYKAYVGSAVLDGRIQRHDGVNRSDDLAGSGLVVLPDVFQSIFNFGHATVLL